MSNSPLGTTIFRPRTPGNNWAYWRVENLADFPAATKRCRNRIAFILTAEGARKHGAMTCVYCKRAIEMNDENGGGSECNVYGEYFPKHRTAKLWHYQCGWGALLSDIIIDGQANRILAPVNIQL